MNRNLFDKVDKSSTTQRVFGATISLGLEQCCCFKFIKIFPYDSENRLSQLLKSADCASRKRVGLLILILILPSMFDVTELNGKSRFSHFLLGGLRLAIDWLSLIDSAIGYVAS